MFVRNPALRLRSAYIDKFLHGDMFQEQARVMLNVASKYQNQTQSTLIKFNEFIWIITNSLLKRDRHWLPITQACDPCGTDYHFIGKLETFHADLQYILNTRFNVSEQRYVKLHEYGTSHATNSSLANTQELLSSLSRAEKQRLYGHIQQDADIFGYDVEDILR